MKFTVGTHITPISVHVTLVDLSSTPCRRTQCFCWLNSILWIASICLRSWPAVAAENWHSWHWNGLLWMLKYLARTSHVVKSFPHPSQCQERAWPAGYFLVQPGCSALPWCCNMSSTVEHWKPHSWNGQLTGPVSGSLVGMCVNLCNSSFPTIFFFC